MIILNTTVDHVLVTNSSNLYDAYQVFCSCHQNQFCMLVVEHARLFQIGELQLADIFGAEVLLNIFGKNCTRTLRHSESLGSLGLAHTRRGNGTKEGFEREEVTRKKRDWKAESEGTAEIECGRQTGNMEEKRKRERMERKLREQTGQENDGVNRK